MSKFDVSDFDADELNQGIDDTNFPNSRHASVSTSSAQDEPLNKSLPLAVKPNGFNKSLDDEVFDVSESDIPKTPRSLPTPGNCSANYRKVGSKTFHFAGRRPLDGRPCMKA
jgi:hypothetical protein